MPNYISKIQLPDGNIYDLKAVLNYIIAYKDGLPTSEILANVPNTVSIEYNSQTYNGTLSPGSTTCNSIYLVKSNTQEGTGDYYDEWITIDYGESAVTRYVWEKLGDTRIGIVDLTATKENITVISTNTTESKPVSGGSTDVVLGADTTFSITGASATDGSTKKYLHSDTFIKSITPTTDSAIKTLSVGKANLSTTTITGTDGTETVSKVTKTTKKLVTTSVAGVNGSTSVTGVSGSTSVYGVKSGTNSTTTASKATAGTAMSVGDGTVTSSSSCNDILMGATVSSETLILGACTLDTTSITPYTFSDVTVPIRSDSATTVPKAASSATTVPIAATAITVATGKLAASDTNGDDVGSAVSISNKTVAKVASSATTVATGAVSSSSTGNIITSVGPDDTITSVTSLGTPTTGTAFSTLNTTSSDEGAVITDVQLTLNPGTISVGTNDQVTALTSAGSVTVPKITTSTKSVVTDVTYSQDEQ